jgi:hypothetical protein
MAIDKSEPRVGLIFRIGFLIVGLLIGTRALLNSYFDQIAHAEETHKIGQAIPQPLIDLRADEEHRLTSGPMPVEQAMQTIASKGRMAASPDIMPSASRDLGPLQGWSKLPREVPAMMTAPPPEAVDAGAPPAAVPGDAGAHPTGAPGAAPLKKPLKKP